MPRIPEAEIERIKQQTDLAALVRARGVELRQHGSKDLSGKCPFHQDDAPSFIVSPDKGLYHCMGCGAAGNVIQFVQKFDGVSFRHAFELLSAGTVAFSAPAATPLKISTVPRLPNPFGSEADLSAEALAKVDDAELISQVLDYYHDRLWKTPGALEYLRGRGLLHEETLKRFRFGFSDRTLGLRLPSMNRKDGEAIRTRLQTLGVYRPTGREHFNGCVLLPIFAADGSLGEIYGRRVVTHHTTDPRHMYLPGPHAGIWNAEALDAPELILCEAPFDALTFYVHGFHNVTFIYGTEGFTGELFEAILARKVRRIRIAYDADEAGDRAAKRDAERFAANGIEVFRVKFPWGMDANEYAQRQATGTLRKSIPPQPPDQALQTALNSADWMGAAVHKRPTVSIIPEAPTVATPAPHTPTPAPSSSLAAVLAADEKLPNNPANPVNPVQETPTLTRQGDYHTLTLGPREYRIGGLDKNNSLDVLKVAVRLRVGVDPSTPLGEFLFHLDSFDMAQDSQRRRFIERAAEETRLEKELIKRDLGKLLLAMETAQQERISAVLAPTSGAQVPEMSAEERSEALAFLQSPDLVAQIGTAFENCGLVGESANRLAAYLACTSRKLDKPLAVIIQSTSAAGKSTLMESVLAMFPEEERIKYSAMTGQSLYYLGETNLQHKILAIVEEEGAEKAGYALKLLQSEGELTIASTGKDPQTGRMETQEYHVEGPVMIFLTTTAVDIDEELQNRCLTLTVDESREQTERIHTLQRQARTLEGLRLKKQKARWLTLLRNAQRLLQPVDIMNPFADQLTFTSDRTRTRRDHEKYLTLIDTIALLHQHQRPTESDPESGAFIRVTLDDIALANRLAPELLGRSLDELPPQPRRLLEVVKSAVKVRCKEQHIEQAQVLFSRRDLQKQSGWSYSQVKRHLFRLQELEYIAPRFGRMGSMLKYELLIDADEPAETSHIGLLDVEKLRKHTPTPTTWTGQTATLTPHGQNTMARLAPAMAESYINLATLPKRTSGAVTAVAV